MTKEKQKWTDMKEKNSNYKLSGEVMTEVIPYIRLFQYGKCSKILNTSC